MDFIKLKEHLPIRVDNATVDHQEEWSEIFLEGLKSCPATKKYLQEQKITERDVELSFIQDLEAKSEIEQFLIAYYKNSPAGIIRLESYYVPNNVKILSHFPLVLPKYQRKGVGRALVQQGVKNAKKLNFSKIWAECWSTSLKEIETYKLFYNKIGFNSKSSRLEMSCNLRNITETISQEFTKIDLVKNEEINNELTIAISKSYSDSKDILHKIEELGVKEIAQNFLQKTKETFTQAGFIVQNIVAFHEKKLCAGLLTATSNRQGIILEIGVLPEFRGRNIAKTLIGQYLLEMKQQGKKEVTLGVDEQNIPAINLYEKLGFIKTWHGIMMQLVQEEKLFNE